jgi:hypothetical protein
VVLGLVVGVNGTALAQGKDAAAKPAPAPTQPAPKQAPPPKPAPPPPAKPAPPPPKKPGKPLTAQQKQDEAKRLYGEGKTKFDAGDYAGAYELYRQADELVPEPPVPKFGMAQCLDKQGKTDEAIKAYEAFLAGKPRADKDAQRITDAKARIEALKNAPADVNVVLQPAEAAGAALTLDGQPATNPVKVPPGKHTIAATLDGFEEAKVEIEVQRGEKKDVTLTLTPKPKDAVVETPPPGGDKPPVEKPPAPEPSSGTSIIPAVVTLSLAGAGVVVGGVFGGLALKSKSDYEATPTQELFDETERNALIADMAFGVGLTFGVTGLVLLLTSGGDEEAPPAPASGFVTPFFTPHGGGAAGVFKF